MPFIAYPLMLLQASLASVVAGLLLCTMLWLAVRRWPALAARRSPWLAAQLLLAGVFVLSLLPHSQVVSVVPEMHLPVAASLPEQAMTADRLLPAATQLPASAAPDWPPLLALLPWIWLAIYTAGMALAAWRQWRGHARLAQLLSLARHRRTSWASAAALAVAGSRCAGVAHAAGLVAPPFAVAGPPGAVFTSAAAIDDRT